MKFLSFTIWFLLTGGAFADDCVGPVERLGGVNPNPQRPRDESRSRPVKKNLPAASSVDRGPAAIVDWSNDLLVRKALDDLGFGQNQKPTQDEIHAAYRQLVKEANEETKPSFPAEVRQDAKLDLGKYNDALNLLIKKGKIKPPSR